MMTEVHDPVNCVNGKKNGDAINGKEHHDPVETHDPDDNDEAEEDGVAETSPTAGINL